MNRPDASTSVVINGAEMTVGSTAERGRERDRTASDRSSGSDRARRPPRQRSRAPCFASRRGRRSAPCDPAMRYALLLVPGLDRPLEPADRLALGVRHLHHRILDVMRPRGRHRSATGGSARRETVKFDPTRAYPLRSEGSGVCARRATAEQSLRACLLVKHDLAWRCE